MKLLQHAWQSWQRATGVFLLAAGALAVGIGAATAIFTVVNLVMLKPLSYAEGERYGALFSATAGYAENRGSLVLRDVLEYQRSARSFDVFGWFKPQAFSLTAPGSPQHVEGTLLTTTLARSLGVQPILGQWFQDEHGAVISQRLWERLGGTNEIVGKAIVLNGRSYTITGVMPERFRMPEVGHTGVNTRGDVWAGLDPQGRGQNLNDGFTFAYARLRPDVTFAQADAEVKSIAAEIARRDPATHRGYTAAFDPLRDLATRGIRTTLVLLLGAAGLLLVLTCANVAALLLAQSIARARDTAIRVALGASQRQLALQYLVEGLFVSVAGAVAGVVIAAGLVRVFLAIAADYIPRAEEAALDWRVMLFAGIVAALAASLASLAPLWQAARTQPNEVLNEGVRASASVRTRRLSRALVVGEIALAFALLAMSAVLFSNLNRLTRTWPGFDPTNLLKFNVTIPDAISVKGETLVPHQVRLMEALKQVPGVRAVSFTNQTPLDGCCLSTNIYPDGAPSDQPIPQKTAFLPITPAFFETMGIPLTRGRLLTYHDADSEWLMVVINQAAARQYWPGRDPVGAFGRIPSRDGTRFQVVGVVGDIKNDGLNRPTVPEVYMLHTVGGVNPMHVVVRSAVRPETLIPALRRAVEAFDPAQPIHAVATISDIAYRSVALERVGSLMTAFFAAAALLMATLGVYGVIAYAVRQRTVEIGTRMALGAVARDLLSLVVGDGMKMAVYGLAVGALVVAGAAWLIVRAFEIRELGWAPFAQSTAIIAMVAAAASFVPAWRATWLSPMVAIRNEPRGAWQSAREHVARAVKALSRSAEDDGVVPDNTLVAEFVDAARRAESSEEALRLALDTLRERIAAESIALLETGGAELRPAIASGATADNAAIPNRGFLVSRLRYHAAPLPISPDDLDALARWSAANRPEYAAEIAALASRSVRLAVALFTKKDVTGVLLLGPPIGRKAYSRGERAVLRQAADQLALMLENARLTARIVEQEKLRRDLALAAEVQRRLLPERPPRAEIGALAAVTLAARSVAGDYYDFLVGDHRLGIALADVSGKGIAAALIMSAVQASLRIISSDEQVSLPTLAGKMNDFLHRATQSNSYATFFYAQIDERTGRLRYVNAGHNPPYLVRAPLASSHDGRESRIEELTAGGTVLGLFPGMAYDEDAVDLQSGDVLFMFTDGVTEALNVADEEFGEERLRSLLREIRHLPVDELTAKVSEALKAWSGAAVQNDDLTFVVMKVR